MGYLPCLWVAIPSNRVNVSYLDLNTIPYENTHTGSCRNPLKSGQCFLLSALLKCAEWGLLVAIPSNRVNVSYTAIQLAHPLSVQTVSQSPQIGSMFLTLQSCRNWLTQVRLVPSQSPQIGSMFLTSYGDVITCT